MLLLQLMCSCSLILVEYQTMPLFYLLIHLVLIGLLSLLALKLCRSTNHPQISSLLLVLPLVVIQGLFFLIPRQMDEHTVVFLGFFRDGPIVIGDPRWERKGGPLPIAHFQGLWGGWALVFNR